MNFTSFYRAAGSSVAIVALMALAGCRGEEGRYQNPYLTEQHGGFGAYVAMRLFGDDEWAAVDPEDPGVGYENGAGPVDAQALTVTWVGHSTVLLRYRGISILTDPIWSERASPLSFAGPKRYTRPGLAFEDLPPIDFVIISHNHYDHLDAGTIARLGDGPRYLVPAGVERWFAAQGIAAERVHRFEWWREQSWTVPPAGQGADAAVKINVQALPSQHFSGRGLFDRNRTLWASWAIQIEDARVFFAGDTGYNPVQFREVGERAGPFDLAVIPVGAYRPRSFMGPIHVDPAGAVAIHQDVRARYSLGIHWGAFVLTAEHPREVIADLSQARAVAKVPAKQFELWSIGESREVPVAQLTPPAATP